MLTGILIGLGIAVVVVVAGYIYVVANWSIH